MWNQRQNINYSLFESSKADKKWREKDGEKAKQISSNYYFALSQVQLGCLKLKLSSQYRGYWVYSDHTSRRRTIRQYLCSICNDPTNLKNKHKNKNTVIVIIRLVRKVKMILFAEGKIFLELWVTCFASDLKMDDIFVCVHIWY